MTDMKKVIENIIKICSDIGVDEVDESDGIEYLWYKKRYGCNPY